jgi:hypothetical protein
MSPSTHLKTLVCGAAVLAAATADGQVLGPSFSASFNIRDLGVAADVPPPYGALQFCSAGQFRLSGHLRGWHADH